MYNIKSIITFGGYLMKRTVLILLSILLVLAFAACGVEDPLNPNNTNEASDPASGEQSNEVADTNYEDSIAGIYNYMRDLDLINDADPTKMAADLIGAKEGNKYSYRLNGTQVTVELYSYDTDNLNDTAKEIIDSVKSSGKFEILGLGEVEAVLSDSGKYLLVYSDKAFDSNKPNENNVERRDRFVAKFKAFHN